MKYLVFTLLLFLSGFCLAEEVRNTDMDMPVLGLVDDTHSYVSSQLTDWVDGIDQFFGEEKYMDRENGSQLLVRYQATRYRNGQLYLEPKLRARIDLPRTQQRLRLMIETNEGDQSLSSDLDSNASALNNDVSDSLDPDFFSTALQLVITMGDNLQLNARAGLAFREGVDPFALMRAYGTVAWKGWNFRMSQYIYQYALAGFGEETLLDIDRKIFSNALLRFSSNLNWWYVIGNFEASESIAMIVSLTPRFAVSLNAVTEQIHAQSWTNKNNFIFATARWRFYKNWAFLQVTPQWQFNPETNYAGEPSLTVGVEVLFGRKVDRKNFPHRPKRMETIDGPQRSVSYR